MRPIKLVMRAFGPYAIEQEVDFNILGDRTFFLIHGPTGAGKTSILDAICFALYGETSGGERQTRHLRSDYADPNTLTEVTFDFSLGQEMYRVYRRPEQERPKKRGGGITKEPAKAILWKAKRQKGKIEEGPIIAGSLNRVNEEIELILGFRSDQFRQVVVLPQGQFRRLLSAGSSERQHILEVLFQTDIYRHMEEMLKNAADQTKNKVATLQANKNVILAQVGVKDSDELANQLNDAMITKDEIEGAIKNLEQDEKSAENELAHAKEVVRKLQEYVKAKTALQSMEIQKEEFQNKGDRLVRARKASRLKDLENDLRNREEEFNESQQSLDAAQATLESAQKKQLRAEEEFKRGKARQGERDSARREADKLESLFTQVEELAGARKNLSKLEEEVLGFKSLFHEKKTHLKECEQALQEAQKDKEATAMLEAKVDGIKLEYKKIQRAYEQRTELEQLHRDHKKAKINLSEVQRKIKKTKEERSAASRELDILEERWNKGQATVLARQLMDGVPCPVCGATEHPSPAEGEGKLPTELDIRDARELFKEKDRLIEELQDPSSSVSVYLAGLETKIKTLEAELGALKDENISTLNDRVDKSMSRLKQASEAKKILFDLEAKMKRLEKTKEQSEKDTERVKNELQEATTAFAVEKNSVMQFESKIPEGYRTKKRLEEAITEARNKYQEMETIFQKAQEEQNKAGEAKAGAEATLKNAKKNESNAHDLVDKARKIFLKRLESAGFSSAEDYEASRMEDETIEELDEVIQEFNGKLREADERVCRAKKEAEGLDQPDLEPIEEKFVGIKKKLEEAFRHSGEVNKHIEQLSSAVRDVKRADKKLGEKEAYYGVIGGLSEVASGRNAYNITFERFVLATLLDDVLAAASTRLQMMSNGRFDLQRMAGVDDKRKAGGLDLVVYDAYTGTTRPVNTLSGGEGFLASLSLALALADVVQSYAGGINLDTIFIDEGFGSLDPESLDLALRTLVDLQKGGRLVGIISHVPELKERVDVRLEVLPSKSGSEARFVL